MGVLWTGSHRGGASPTCGCRRGALPSLGGGLWQAGGRDPDVPFVVDSNGASRLRPFISLARTAPVADQIAGLIELENLRRRDAAAGRRVEDPALFVIAERIGASMCDPDVILAVNGHACYRTENPVIWQRLWPQRVHFEDGRLNSAASLSGR